jgi:hypothetical protein
MGYQKIHLFYKDVHLALVKSANQNMFCPKTHFNIPFAIFDKEKVSSLTVEVTMNTF